MGDQSAAAENKDAWVWTDTDKDMYIMISYIHKFDMFLSCDNMVFELAYIWLCYFLYALV